MHRFQAHLKWSKKTEVGQDNRKRYKNHMLAVADKNSLEVSAAKAFKGDPTKWNPEEMLLDSLMSCHMMSYLYVCQQNGVEVLAYEDAGEAFLEVNADGSGKVTKVILGPKVVISNAEQIDLAKELHIQANQLCFIANSCAFEVEHNPEINLSI